jgi:lipopolysaccharide exporter
LSKIYSRIKSTFKGTFLGQDLRARAARGGVWLSGASFAEQVVRFARNLILTRLIAPGAFGAMAIVLSLASLFASFSDVGIGPAIIQNPRGSSDEYLNAAWWMGVGRVTFTYLAIFIAAPWVAQFYGNPDLTPLLRIAMISTVLDGLLSPNSKLAQREMTFGHWTFINNGGRILGVFLTIGLSFAIRGVWALAIGYCGENAFRCLFSYILYPKLPSFGWDKKALRDLLKFSRGMLGLSFLNLIFARADIFVLGKMHTAAELGIYALAVNLVQTPISFVINVVSGAMLPALAHVQNDRQRLNKIVLEVTSWAVLLGLPALAMIYLSASSLLALSYGQRYAVSVAAQALVLASIVGLLNTLNSFLTNSMFATGEPRLHRRAVGVSAIVMVILIYPACKVFGLPGGQAAALTAIFASYLLQLVRILDINKISFRSYSKYFAPAALAAIGVLVAGVGAHYFGLGARPLTNIAISTAICIAAYIACAPVFGRIRWTAWEPPV